MTSEKKTKSKTALTEELRRTRKEYKTLSKIWLDQIEATNHAKAEAAALTAEIEALRRIKEKQGEIIEGQKRIIEGQEELIRSLMDRTKPRTEPDAPPRATHEGRRHWKPRRRRIR